MTVSRAERRYDVAVLGPAHADPLSGARHLGGHRVRAVVAGHALHGAGAARHDSALLDDVGPPDAALFALSLSVMPDPAGVLASTAALLVPGGRVAVMDAGVPPEPGAAQTGSAVLRPVWRAVCRLAAADCQAHPWEHVRNVAGSSAVEAFHFGYVRVAAATLSAGRDRA